MSVLLDTHALLWWLLEERRLSPRQRRAVRAASPEDPLLVSDFTLQEIATLVELRRVELDVPVRDWLEQATAPPLVRVLPIGAAVAAEVAALPPGFHRDPADRIIVSTARVFAAALLTSDRRIIDSGLVSIIS